MTHMNFKCLDTDKENFFLRQQKLKILLMTKTKQFGNYKLFYMTISTISGALQSQRDKNLMTRTKKGSMMI